MSSDRFLRCLRCSAAVFLVRGLCRTCAPSVHREFVARVESVRAISDSFERRTGKHPFEDWRSFEDEMKRDFNDDDVSELSAAVEGKTISRVEIDSPRDERFLVLKFADGSNFRLRYDYIYDWELDE